MTAKKIAILLVELETALRFIWFRNRIEIMDTWHSELMDMVGDLERWEIEAIACIIEMAERDYENHLQKKEKKNES